MLRSTNVAQALTGVLVDDRHDLDQPPVDGHVELEVHRPHPIGGIGDDRRRGRGGAVTFALSPLRHPQAFITPKMFEFLMIDDPAFAAGIVVGGPEAATRMVLGVFPQPVPQGGVGVA